MADQGDIPLMIAYPFAGLEASNRASRSANASTVAGNRSRAALVGGLNFPTVRIVPTAVDAAYGALLQVGHSL